MTDVDERTGPARAPLPRPAFGISVTPVAAAYRAIVDQVRAADRHGLDLVGIQDHPYQRRFLDTFSLMADVLARTERVHVFPDVASLPMRPPTMLAKAAVSLDVMSGGRFELGLGAGAFWDAVAGMGGPRREGAERIDALAEAIAIVREALDVGEEKRIVRGDGGHYPVPGYPAGPPASHRVEIWVGAMHPRTLALIGRAADGWIPGGGLRHLSHLASLAPHIDEAALAAGRDPRAVRRILNVHGTIDDGAGDGELLEGPAERWVETLTGWTLDLGIDAFILWPTGEGTEQIERFAAEVVPAVRSGVAATDA